jgi:DNA polymerase III subunit epsilon
MKHLKLDRPLVCFDLETTGVSVERDRIVEIGMVRVEPDGSRRTYRSLVNPDMPIPPQATAVHGISDEDVAGAPRLENIGDEIFAMLEGADLAGFNSISFDMPFLENELKRVGLTADLRSGRHLDAMRIFHKMEPRTLSAAYRKFIGGDLTDAHSALADVEATLDVLDAMVGHYEDLTDNPDELHKLCHQNDGCWVDRSRKFIWNDKGQACFAFGKYRDRTIKDVVAENSGYLEWMLGKDFSDEIMQILRNALEGKFPEKK